jgi:hypothetical protein
MMVDSVAKNKETQIEQGGGSNGEPSGEGLVH